MPPVIKVDIQFLVVKLLHVKYVVEFYHHNVTQCSKENRQEQVSERPCQGSV